MYWESTRVIMAYMQKTTCSSQLSSFTKWGSEFELRLGRKDLYLLIHLTSICVDFYPLIISWLKLDSTLKNIPRVETQHK